jgi:hypothetical protein
MIAWLKNGLTETVAAAAAEAVGVSVGTLARFCVRPFRRDGLVLGYGAYDIGQIRAAVQSLSRGLRQIKEGAGPRHSQAVIHRCN